MIKERVTRKAFPGTTVKGFSCIKSLPMWKGVDISALCSCFSFWSLSGQWSRTGERSSFQNSLPVRSTHLLTPIRCLQQSCLPTVRYLRVSPARWDVEWKLQWEDTPAPTLPICRPCSLCFQPSAAQNSSSQQLLTVLQLSERLYKCHMNFLLLATSHSAQDRSGSQSPELVGV